MGMWDLRTCRGLDRAAYSGIPVSVGLHVGGSGKHMAKLEIERGPLVGGVLIAVSAAIAVALNTYSGYQAAPVVKDAPTQVQPAAEDDSAACCERAACSHAEPQTDPCAPDVKRD
jgi:hypothetical protein